MYNIFKNDFYSNKPAPKWSFTVEFFLSDELETRKLQSTDTEEDKSKAEWYKSLKNFLTESNSLFKEDWEETLSKSVTKIPITHPESQAIPYRLPGYAYHLPGRYTRSNSITLTFSDNIDRDVRFILESLMYGDGLNYANDQILKLPTLPNILKFDMRVRIYDVERVNLYEPTEGFDRVSEKGTVQSYYYKGCFVSKLGDETNTYEGSENIRTIDATITYREMNPE